METTTPAPTVWPGMRFRDAKGLIKFLVDAFGFESTLVVEGGGVVHHAELRWPLGGGVMLGDDRQPEDEDYGSRASASRTRKPISGHSAPTEARKACWMSGRRPEWGP
jgi:uncharacterized glyoxalase superfamily protein PhnB